MSIQCDLIADPVFTWGLRITLPPNDILPEQVFLRPTSSDRLVAERIAADVTTLFQTPQWTDAALLQAVFHPQALAIAGDPALIAYLPYRQRENEAWMVRDEHLPLPQRRDGYHRVLLIGETGAGKTSVLRQFLGEQWTDFPATGRDRTTTGFFEAIFTQSSTWRAVITFHPRHVVFRWIDQCLQEAVQRALNGEPEQNILAPFDEDPMQRVRFTNIISLAMPMALHTDLPEQHLVAWITHIADDLRQRYPVVRETADADAEPSYPLAEWLQTASPLYQVLRLHLLDMVQQALRSMLAESQSDLDAWGWPRFTQIDRQDETAMRQAILPFSRNPLDDASHVTSLVNGIRLAGPFLPRWRHEVYSPHLVLIDGEGLGHAGEMADGGLPPEYTRLFPLIDHLLWVVSGDHPFGQGTKAIVTDITQRAWVEQLFLVYTKSEPREEEGETEQKMREKLNKDMTNGIARLSGTGLGQIAPRFSAQLRQRLSTSSYFLRAVNSRQPNDIRDEQLELLLQAVQRAPFLAVPSSLVRLPDPSDDELAFLIRQVGDRFWKEDWRLYVSVGSAWKRLQTFGKTLSATGSGYSSGYFNPIRSVTSYFGEAVLDWWNAQIPLDETEEMLLNARQQVIGQLMSRLEARLRPRLREDLATYWEVFHYTFGAGGATIGRYTATLRTIFELWFPYTSEFTGWEIWLGQVQDLLILPVQEQAA